MTGPLAAWTPPPHPSREPIEGRYTRLEPLDPSRHTNDLAAACAEDETGAMWQYLPVGPFEASGLVEWVRRMSIPADPMAFAIRDLDTGAVGGLLTLLRIDPANGSMEVGYITLAPRLQRSRAATEAIILTCRMAFRLGYRRFEWKCNAANLPSRRAAQRYGFSYEGIFRQAGIVKGNNRDTAWFAMIDSEASALDAAWSSWLEPENFDETGTQRQRLSDMTRPVLHLPDPALA